MFVDGSLLESEMFHNGREAQYPAALEARIKQFVDGGWTETSIDARPSLKLVATRVRKAPNDGRARDAREEAWRASRRDAALNLRSISAEDGTPPV